MLTWVTCYRGYVCRHGDHYKWDKVTTCVYNIMSGERSVDHYGTMKIVNKDTCYCKLTFYKVHIRGGCNYSFPVPLPLMPAYSMSLNSMQPTTCLQCWLLLMFAHRLIIHYKLCSFGDLLNSCSISVWHLLVG